MKRTCSFPLDHPLLAFLSILSAIYNAIRLWLHSLEDPREQTLVQGRLWLLPCAVCGSIDDAVGTVITAVG